jgi:hypothetical protein
VNEVDDFQHDTTSISEEVDVAINIGENETETYVCNPISPSPPAVCKKDRRGLHWADKVKDGKPPTASGGNIEWAQREKVREEEYQAFMTARKLDPSLPWKINGAVRTAGNTKKVIYMELLMLHYNQSVTRVERLTGTAEGLFGIVGFAVPPGGREAFDAGSVPSIDSSAGTARKSVSKIWKTAGFLEEREADGTLRYEYHAAVAEKQRAQQSGKRRRTE